MLTVKSGKLLPTAHAEVRVDPFWWCGRVEHAARNLLLRRKVEVAILQCLVYLVDISQCAFSSLCSHGPVLDQLQDFGLDLLVDLRFAVSIQHADQLVHELSARDFLHEVQTSIFDTRVCEVKCCELHVWILVAYSPLQASHSIFWRDSLATD